MKWSLLLSAILLWTCNGSSQSEKSSSTKKEQLKAQVDHLEQLLMQDSSDTADPVKAQPLIEKSLKFISLYPADPQSPAYLFRTAEVCVGIGQFQQAVQLFRQLHQNYPQHPKAPTASFLQAFTLDNHLQDKEGAKAAYQSFIQAYPKHDLAQQARGLLENLEMSPEELIKSFQKEGS